MPVSAIATVQPVRAPSSVSRPAVPSVVVLDELDAARAPLGAEAGRDADARARRAPRSTSLDLAADGGRAPTRSHLRAIVGDPLAEELDDLGRAERSGRAGSACAALGRGASREIAAIRSRISVRASLICALPPGAEALSARAASGRALASSRQSGRGSRRIRPPSRANGPLREPAEPLRERETARAAERPRGERASRPLRPSGLCSRPPSPRRCRSTCGMSILTGHTS